PALAGPCASDQRQRVRGFQIDDIAAARHRAGVFHADAPRRDVFVLVRPVRRTWRRVAQIEDAEKDHLLVAVARRRVPCAESLDSMRRPADLLFALASRRRLRRLARLQTARGKLPRLTIDWRSILPD